MHLQYRHRPVSLGRSQSHRVYVLDLSAFILVPAMTKARVLPLYVHLILGLPDAYWTSRCGLAADRVMRQLCKRGLFKIPQFFSITGLCVPLS